MTWNPSAAAANTVSLMSADRIEVRQVTPSSAMPLVREFRGGHSRYEASVHAACNTDIILQFHPRSVVDASWCEGNEASLLASGSADGFVKVWILFPKHGAVLSVCES